MQSAATVFCHFSTKPTFLLFFCNKKARHPVYGMPRVLIGDSDDYFFTTFFISFTIAFSAAALAASSFFCAAASAFALPAAFAAFTSS